MGEAHRFHLFWPDDAEVVDGNEAKPVLPVRGRNALESSAGDEVEQLIGGPRFALGSRIQGFSFHRHGGRRSLTFVNGDQNPTQVG